MSEDSEEELIKVRMLQRIIESTRRLQTYPSEPVELSDFDFESFIKKYDRTVVDCWAAWCQPCQMIAPAIEEFAKKYHGKVVFGKLNVDRNRMTVTKYDIMSIPTLLIFRNGVLVDRVIGALPKPLLEAKIRKALGL